MLLRRVWCILRRRKLEVELAEELDFHREMTRQRLEADGVAATDAAIAARRTLGSDAAVREHVRDMWTWRWLDDAFQDVRYAGRQVTAIPAARFDCGTDTRPRNRAELRGLFRLQRPLFSRAGHPRSRVVCTDI